MRRGEREWGEGGEVGERGGNVGGGGIHNGGTSDVSSAVRVNSGITIRPGLGLAREAKPGLVGFPLGGRSKV